MKLRWIYFLLFIAGLIVTGSVAAFQSAAGYMDADYYYLGGLRLAEGFGFTEPILWNYLGEPESLPQPSHGYWMPLASILAYAGIYLTGNPGFAGARVLFLVCTSLLPPLTAALSLRITGRKDQAILAGLFAVFSSFYLPFLGTTDTFGLYMLLGGVFFLTLELFIKPRKAQHVALAALFLGGLSGAMHLARADGILWLVIGGAALIWSRQRVSDEEDAAPAGRDDLRRLFLLLVYLLTGYLLVMGAWFGRNLAEFGQPLAPGGLRALWMLDYDELFAYPPNQLTFGRWWASGLVEILSVRLSALGLNLGNTLAVQGQIFLTPLVLLGGWRLRGDLRVRIGLLAWGLTLVSMTVFFPFPGSRGGFFHSGAALQVLIWALAPVGLDAFVKWGNRRRGWNVRQATVIFGSGLVAIAFGLSVVVVQRRVIGADFSSPAWVQSDQVYSEIEVALQEAGAELGEPVLINNPPGFYLASRRPAVVIPDGNLETLLQAAAHYQVDYLVLEQNHPRPLEPLYQAPGDRPGLVYLTSIDGTYIFYVAP